MEFFSLIAEDSFNSDDHKGAIVTGFAVGKVSVGDKLFFYHPSKKILTAVVKTILVGADEYRESATNQPAALEFEGLRKGDISKFMVITNVPKILLSAENSAYNNPELLGLLYGCQKFSKDSRFMTVLIYYLNRATFLLDVQTEEEIKTSGVQEQDVRIKVNPVVNKDDSKAIAIYTDTATAQKGVPVLANPPKRNIMMVNLAIAAEFSKNNCDGVVINPNGPIPFFMENSFLKHLGIVPNKK